MTGQVMTMLEAVHEGLKAARPHTVVLALADVAAQARLPARGGAASGSGSAGAARPAADALQRDAAAEGSELIAVDEPAQVVALGRLVELAAAEQRADGEMAAEAT